MYHGCLDENGVQVGEHVPLGWEDGGDEGEQDAGGRCDQGDHQEGQEAGDYWTKLHQEMKR